MVELSCWLGPRDDLINPTFLPGFDMGGWSTIWIV
jgi:hypothetical protein